MISEKVSFPCDDIRLEGELQIPGGESQHPCVIVCHPHPLYGGNMMNNVVTAICKELNNRSIAALRFNFRRVGNSGGSFGSGIAEQEDVKAALDYVLSNTYIDSKMIGLAGYSFGGGVALPAALRNEQISILALVSLALVDSGWEQLKEYDKPVYVVFGDADTVIPLEGFRWYMQDVNKPERYRLISGADHFWWGYEEELTREVAGFFESEFGQTCPVINR